MVNVNPYNQIEKDPRQKEYEMFPHAIPYSIREKFERADALEFERDLQETLANPRAFRGSDEARKKIRQNIEYQKEARKNPPKFIIMSRAAA